MISLRTRFINFVIFSFYTWERISNYIWLVLVYPFFYIYLLSKGYSKVRFFKFSDWHLSCRYLTAELDENLVFIKCGRSFLIKNEVVANSNVSKLNSVIVSNVYGFYSSKFSPVNYVVFDFLSNYRPISKIKKLKSHEFKSLSSSLKNIISVISDSGITHRDISPSNLFVNPNDFNDVKIIDFAMSHGVGLSKLKYFFINSIVLKSLGKGYKKSLYSWDDSYSLSLVISELEEKIVD